MNKMVAPTATDHNKPAILTADMLAKDFGHLDKELAEIKRDIDGCPPVVEDEEDLEVMRAAVRRCMSQHKRLEVARTDTKEPYLSASRVVDAHFNKMKDVVAGWQSSIEGRAHRFLKKREAEERARREEEARAAAEAARVAAAAARKAENERIAAEQARMAAAFDNSPEVEAPPLVDVDTARRQESVMATEALMASHTAIKASEAAIAKPADLSRTRTGTGVSTLAEIWCSEIEDLDAIDLNALREHIPRADIEKAISRYVSVHKGDRPLKGVRIYSDTKIRMT